MSAAFVATVNVRLDVGQVAETVMVRAIKDGIRYHVPTLMKEIKEMVAAAAAGARRRHCSIGSGVRASIAPGSGDAAFRFMRVSRGVDTARVARDAAPRHV